jgi:hypothetical protein
MERRRVIVIVVAVTLVLAFLQAVAIARMSAGPEFITVDTGGSSLDADEYFFTLRAKRTAESEYPAMRIKMDGNGKIVSQETSATCRFAAYKPIGKWFDAWIEQCEGEGPAVVFLGEKFEVLNRPPGWYIDGHDFFIDGAHNVYTIITHPHTDDSGPYGFSIQKQSPTRELLFDWSSDDHMSNVEAYIPRFRDADWAHVNSIDVLWPYIIVSLRHTNAIVAIDERTGDIAWRLGGSMNDFTPVRGWNTRFSCMQHTARFIAPDLISVYDNGNHCRTYSRGVVFKLNFDKMTVVQITEAADQETYGGSGGSFQSRLESHIVSWGHTSPGHDVFITEFNPDGRVDFTVSNPDFFSYQVYRRYHTDKVLYLPVIQFTQQ